MVKCGSPKVLSPITSPTRHRVVTLGQSDEEISKKELMITNFIVGYPGACLGIVGTFFLFTTIIAFMVVGISVSDGDLLDRDDYRTERHHAVNELRDLIKYQPSGTNETQVPFQHLRSQTLGAFSFIYEAKGGGNVFTLDAVKFMRKSESHLQYDSEYKNHCILRWIPPGSDCPGYDCPWYITTWDYTEDALMPDGSRLVCEPPLQTLSWIMYSMRIVYPEPISFPIPGGNKTTLLYNECDIENDFDTCIKSGIIIYMTKLNNGKSYTEMQQVLESGGTPPSVELLNAFIRVFARLRETAEYSWLTPFFGKGFADPQFDDSDPRKWMSKVTRATISIGGPIEVVDPVVLNPKCQTIKDKTQCREPCLWTPHAGFEMSTEACIPNQWAETGDYDDSVHTKQIEFFTKWGNDFTSFYDDIEGPVDVLYLADGVMFDKFLEIIMRDALLAVISFLFVYLYLQIHTGSFFLATLGMIQVIMPFPMGYFVYRVVFQIEAFYGLSTLTLYIVLAIGADDIFVFMDNWVQSDIRPRADNCTYIKGRMAHAWKIAGTAMGITSMTTMAAFIATMTSPLMEIGLFGLFAAILVFFDYLLVMTFFASAVVIYHRNFENTIGCCCCGNQGCGKWCNCCTCFTALTQTASVTCMESRLVVPRTFETIPEARASLGPLLDHTTESCSSEDSDENWKTVKITNDNTNPQPNDVQAPADIDPAVRTDIRIKKIVACVFLTLAVIFFFLGFVSLQQTRTTALDMVYVIVIGLLFFCASLNCFRAYTQARTEAGLDNSSESSVIVNYAAPFLSGTNGLFTGLRLIPGVVLIILWIVLFMEALKLHPTTKNEQWLPDWHPMQRFMDSMHNDFGSNDQDFAQSVQLTFGLDYNNPIDRSGTNKYKKSDVGKPRFDPFTSSDILTSRVFQEFVISLCDEVLKRSLDPSNGHPLQRTLLKERDQNCYMIGFRDHQYNSNRTFPIDDHAEFISELWKYIRDQRERARSGENVQPHQSHYNKVLFVFGDGYNNPPTGIQAAYIQFNTTLKQYGNPYDDIKDWFDSWEEFTTLVDTGGIFTDDNDVFPFVGSFFHSSEIWVWMQTQSLLVSGAYTGTLVSLSLATGIIFFATFNLLIAIFVLLELIGVVGCVLGIANVLGWELGMIESVSITVLVGLSVDYVVHFAIHYGHVRVPESGFSERQKRVHETIAEMGPTVLGGAATSIGAAIILLCTWIQFFYKFGIFFLFTILFSYLWSMFFFLPVMSVVGPEGDFLSIRPLLAKILPGVFGKSKLHSGIVVPDGELRSNTTYDRKSSQNNA